MLEAYQIEIGRIYIVKPCQKCTAPVPVRAEKVFTDGSVLVSYAAGNTEIFSLGELQEARPEDLKDWKNLVDIVNRK